MTKARKLNITKFPYKELDDNRNRTYYEDSNGSLAWNATKEMQINTYSIVGWIGLVVIVAIGVLILGLVKQIRQ